MPTLLETPPMTADEFLSLPDNGMDRWLINGALREKPATVRNRFHSNIVAQITVLLGIWLRHQPEPRGKLLCGEAGVRLRGMNDSTVVGIDVAYISAELAAAQTAAAKLIDGIPTLVVEVLSPSDTIDEINEKVSAYLAAGVPLVWIVNASRKTVEICRPGEEPTLVNSRGRLSAEPHLPGFEIDVAELFW